MTDETDREALTAPLSALKTAWIAAHPFYATTPVKEREAQFERLITSLQGAARVQPTRDELLELFTSAQHAPGYTHDERTGECLVCPVPLYELSLEEQADAILALFSSAPTVAQVQAEAEDALAAKAFRIAANDVTFSGVPALYNAQSPLAAEVAVQDWLRARADALDPKEEN